MPSIRIRKTPSTYILLPTRFDNDIEASSRSITVRGQRSMGSIPRPSTDAHNAQVNVVMGNKQRARSHTTSGAFESVFRPPINRERSGSRSKVVEHVLSSRRPSVSPPSLSRHGSFAVLDGHGTIRDRLQVSQTDISTHSQPDVRAPGIVESTLELQQSQQLFHHHDDIVDHLDAIGITRFLSVLGYVVLIHPDPQVATVSSLANAANSILMRVFFMFKWINQV